jgi:hypothetical protein
MGVLGPERVLSRLDKAILYIDHASKETP